MQKIIAALDLRDDALLVAENADHIAVKFGASLHLAHVIEPTGNYLASTVVDPLSGIEPTILPNELELADAQKQAAENSIAAIAKQMKTTPISTKVFFGDIEDELLDYAKEINADLIVVGTHQHTGLSRLLSRETSVKILHEAQIPILVIPTKNKKE